MTDPHLDAAPVAPPCPESARKRLHEHLDLLERYAGWLASAGTVRGLLGPRELPRLWDRHILNSVALAELLPTGVRLVDIGSGAGLPGIPVAIVRSDVRVDLVESLLRRATFLSEVVADLGLSDRVQVVHGRAEDPAVVKRAGNAPFATARAVAPLDKLVRWSWPLLAPGGVLLAIKGATAEAEIAEHRGTVTRMRARFDGVVECGADLVDPPTRVVQITKR